jgi:hypothetical protein
VSSWAALDVAIGIVVVYFVLSLLASTVNEAIATALAWRANFLERWLKNLLVEKNEGQNEVAAVDDAIAKIYGHPLLAPLLEQPRWWSADRTKLRRPSYIASDVFAAVLFNPDPGEKAKLKRPPLDQVIAALPSSQLRKIVTTLRQEVGDDEELVRKRFERWYDDSMERVSGWYKRRVQLSLAVIGLVVAITLNVDTLQIVRTLWIDKTVRAAVVAEAGRITQAGKQQPQSLKAAAEQVQQIKALNIPLGWRLKAHDPRDLPHSASLWAAKVIGILITTIALMLGAPFWFDLLSKIVRLRGSGAPPPASDATRSGDAEQKRPGSQIAPA